MIFYSLMFAVFSLHAIFGPSEETKNQWAELLAGENPNAINKYIDGHPHEIAYGLSQVNELKNKKEVELEVNILNSKEKVQAMVGLFFSVGGALMSLEIGIAMKDYIDSSISTFYSGRIERDLAVFGVSVVAVCEGIKTLYNAMNKKSTKDSIEHLKAIKCELLEAQEKKK